MKSKIVISPFGWGEITLKDFETFLTQGLLIKPKTWCRIKFNSNHSILMVFCDREYEFKDYIERYKDFLKIIKKNK